MLNRLTPFLPTLSLYKQKLRGSFIVSDSETEKRVAHYLDESKSAGCPWEQRIFTDRSSAMEWAQGGSKLIKALEQLLVAGLRQ